VNAVKQIVYGALLVLFTTMRGGPVLAKETGKAGAARWIRPSGAGALPRWGIEGGIRFALWPSPIDGTSDGGPRGLVRVGYPVLNGGQDAGLVNYIAVEPEVKGIKGYSELEPSRADGRPGKPMWAGDRPDGPPDAGTVTHPDPKRPEVEELRVTVRMERFDNGAHPYLVLAVRSDRPGELRLQAFNEPDSAPMERCILTATMGNFARLRRLTLKKETVDSRELFKGYDDVHFTGDALFPLERLRTSRRGGVIVPLATDEKEPWIPEPFPGHPLLWRWRGRRETQYWRKEPGTWGPDLQLRVNARFTYWGSRQPIPGGLAYENVELREAYRPGVASIFGITRRTPGGLLRDGF
jgi:hypothetical protein